MSMGEIHRINENKQTFSPETRHRLQIQLQAKVSELNQMLVEIDEGTCVEFVDKMRDIEKSKRSRLEYAEIHFRLSEESTQVAYDYEREEAEEKYELQREKLKEWMLDDVENQIEHTKKLKLGFVAATTQITKRNQRKERKSTRKTRSTAKGKIVQPSDVQMNMNGPANISAIKRSSSRPSSSLSNKTRKKNGNILQCVNIGLTSREIHSDLNQLTQEWKKLKTGNPQTTHGIETARVMRNRLFLNHLIIEEGDEVVITSTCGPVKKITGIVAGMTPSELLLLLSTGCHDTVDIMSIRTGMSHLSLITHTNGSIGSLNDEKGDLLLK